MKRVAALFVILMTSLSAWCRVEPFGSPEKKDTLGLLSAKMTNRARVAIRGAYNPHRLQSNPVSSHYGECMEVRIENITDSTLHLVLPCGTMLHSLDSSAQNMLVSETRYFTLAPRQKKYERINALCGELHKNAPDVYVNYEVGKLAPEPLLRLAQVIEANSAQNKVGQYAVWAVTDKATKNELGEDYELLQASQRLLTQAGINFNIMGRQEVAVNNVTAKNRDNSPVAAPHDGQVSKESFAAVDIESTPQVDYVAADTSNSSNDLPQAEAFALTDIDNSENRLQAAKDDSADLMVYAVGALMLGWGIYLLGKKAVRRSA